MRITELAWCAGFYEGEGSLNTASRSLTLTIAQAERQPLERFQRRMHNRGVIRGPYYVKGRRPIWYLTFAGLDALRVMRLLHPFVGPRRSAQFADRFAWAVGRRMMPNSDKRTCPLGHPYDEANTRVTRAGRRACRTCERARKRAAYAAGKR